MLLECNNPRLVILDIDQMADWSDAMIKAFLDRYPGAFLLSSQVARYPGNVHARQIGQPTDLAVKDLIRARHVNPCDALFITGGPREAARVGSMSVSTIIWGQGLPTVHSQLPDFIAGSYDELTSFLSGAIFGYFGEMLAQGEYGIGQFHLYDEQHILDPSITAQVIAAGRYFPSEDRRHIFHPLSQRILGFKRGKYKETLASIVNHSLTVLNRNDRWDFITSAPGHDSGNRMGELLTMAAEMDTGLFRGVRIDADLITMSRTYGSQKRSGNWPHRAINVNGAFQVRRKISGTGVLIDDVITSGATAMECVKALQSAGADRVLIVALAISQDTQKPFELQPVICKNCGRPMQLRFNIRHETPFFGCHGYPECRGAVKYEAVRHQLNRLNDF